jgi:hypothetical protein
LREDDKKEGEDLEGDLILVWEILKEREGENNCFGGTLTRH